MTNSKAKGIQIITELAEDILISETLYGDSARLQHVLADFLSISVNFTLKNMAQDVNEKVDRQVPLMDEIDTKVDKATSDLKNTNVRLKHTVNKLRSSRNFCSDIILLCIILGIAAYLYNVLKK